MGRVARYKKIKSFDPFSKQQAGGLNLDHVGIWGLGDDGRKVKKKSRTALKLKAQQQAKRLQRLSTKQQQQQKSQKPNPQDFFDRPPDHVAATTTTNDDDDDFDLNDLTGSLKKQAHPSVVANALLLSSSPEDAPVTKQPPRTDTENAGHGSSSTPVSPAEPSFKEQEQDGKPPSTQLPSHSSSSSSSRRVATEPAEEVALYKALQLEDDANHKTKATTKTTRTAERLPGEGKRAYRRRVHQETQQIIQSQRRAQEGNPERHAKKREFMKQKKKNKRKRNQTDLGTDGDNTNDNDDENDKDWNMARPAFGVQAERPPTFRQLPRGAAASNNHNNNKSKPKKPLQIQQEQAIMEQMRQKVQEQYRLVRQKRKGQTFHL